MRDVVCAVDVGTGSARAGLFDRSGALLARAEYPIRMNRPCADHAEHDSEDIWRAVCSAVRDVRGAAGVAPDAVAGLCFDATCSLTVRAGDGQQLPVSDDGDASWDTIVWLDHRAVAEAEECTATGHRVLDHIGQVMSPEMQTPKLMWLKRHRPEAWRAAGLIFDLVDFLTWKASGSTDRSQCALVSKWTYLAHDSGWQPDFFSAVGLDDLFRRAGLPARATPVGEPLGNLLPAAADALDLTTDCVVGTGLIDAFAGALGAVGGHSGDAIDGRLALVGGTSSCVMGFAREPRFAAGLWGPYLGATLPGHWMIEGGQSATGALLDHILTRFGDVTEPDAEAHERIIARITELRRAEGPEFGEGLHVLPDFHGNRTPLADARARGVISGLTFDGSYDALCRLYWRTAVSIALGVRQILGQLEGLGFRVDTLHVTGGHTRNPLLMELYADATGCVACEVDAEDAVLLGTAMAAASAAGWHADLAEAGRAMQRQSGLRRPDPSMREHYDRDYRVLLRMQEHRGELNAIGG